MVSQLSHGPGVEMKPFMSEYGALVSCQRRACFKKMTKLCAHKYGLLLAAFPVQERSSFKCDQCFLRCEKVHRCTRCWTKVYCSQECLDKDWTEVHQKICMPGKETGKVKADRKTRNAERDQALEKWHEDTADVDKSFLRKSFKEKERVSKKNGKKSK